jgi:hypothetical protein
MALIVRPAQHVHTFTYKELSVLERWPQDVHTFTYKELSVPERWPQDVHTFTYKDSQCLIDGITAHTAYTCAYCHILEMSLYVFNATNRLVKHKCCMQHRLVCSLSYINVPSRLQGASYVKN